MNPTSIDDIVRKIQLAGSSNSSLEDILREIELACSSKSDPAMNITKKYPKMLKFIFFNLKLRPLFACELVCKEWAAIINGADFQEHFHHREETQPRLFLSIKRERGRSGSCPPPPTTLSFSSSGDNFADPHRSFISSSSGSPLKTYDCIHGLIRQKFTIVNPSLGLTSEIPPITSEKHRFLGFDPISFRHKLLALSEGEYRVLTIGDESKTWRIIESTTPKLPITKEICIKGMLFYFGVSSLVRFNVAEETVEYFPVPDAITDCLGKIYNLLEYKGNLGIVTSEDPYSCSFVMMVLTDVEQQLWTKLTFDIGAGLNYHRDLGLGAISVDRRTDEIVLVATNSTTMCMVFVNLETRATKQAAIEQRRFLSTRGFAIRDYCESTAVLL